MRPAAITLRPVEERDLPALYEHQADPIACEVASFPPRDRDAFMAHWLQNVLARDDVFVRVILAGDQIVGNVVAFPQDGQMLIGYWIGRSFWGRGIATEALTQLLSQMTTRPARAHVAATNHGSVRVLEKNGFVLESGNAGDGELTFVLESW